MHSRGYVEDLPTKCGQKRYAKMAVLNLSVLPKISFAYEIVFPRPPPSKRGRGTAIAVEGAL